MSAFRPVLRLLGAAFLAAASLSAWSDEAAIRKNFAERNPSFPKVDEVSFQPGAADSTALRAADERCAKASASPSR